MLRRILAIAFLGLVALCHAEEPILIRMMAGPAQGIPPKEATDPRSQARRAVFEEFHRKNPGIRVVNAGGLELKGERAESGFLMSMAGDTAPDVFYVNFRQYYNYIDQGFCRPLNDLIEQDPTVLDRVNPIVLGVLKSYDGKTIYSIPWFQVAIALYFRKDHFLEAGLDPAKPPKNWDEFFEYAKKLSESAPGRSGFGFSAGLGGKAYHWSNFVWQSGGEVVRPAENGVWKSAVATPEAARALDFYRKLTTEKWRGKDGKTYGPTTSVSATYAQDITDGKISMWFAYTNDVVLSMSDLNPALLGVAALPEGPARRANEINAGMWAINSSIKDPKKLAACWKFIKFFAGQEAARINTERFVELGLGNLVNPSWLQKFGFEDLIGQVDPTFVKANEELFKNGHPEPYGRNTQQVYVVLDGALEQSMQPGAPDSLTILKNIASEMDQKLLGYTSPEVMKQRRAWAMGILVCFLAVTVGIVVFAWKRSRRLRQELAEHVAAGTPRARIYRFLFFCLFPAGTSIFVWSYYPLLRGLVIAFQDYRIVKGTEWVGLDNFISVFTQPIFWKSLINSFLYVGLSILIGFFIPIFLAISLNEIPRFKVFFRTVFYLPAMTSGIVIALLWRQFYDKSETGLLNSLLAPIINGINALLGTQIPIANDWLGNRVPLITLNRETLPAFVITE